MLPKCSLSSSTFTDSNSISDQQGLKVFAGLWLDLVEFICRLKLLWNSRVAALSRKHFILKGDTVYSIALGK